MTIRDIVEFPVSQWDDVILHNDDLNIQQHKLAVIGPNVLYILFLIDKNKSIFSCILIVAN